MPQSLSQIYLHLIFSTKNREKNILPKYFAEMFSYIAEILNNLDCRVVVVGGETDHIHTLFGLSRTKSASEIVRSVKIDSAKWFQEKLGCGFAWQSGYAVFSVSASQLEIVVNYIRNQTAHHQKKSFEDEYRDFLRNYGVKFDEKYVWD